jgi:hypothetical protein
MEDDYLGSNDDPFEKLCHFPVDEGIHDNVEDIIPSTLKH